MKGKRKRGRQKKRWKDNIKEWTGMDFASSTRAAENRSRWKGIVANSSVVPRRPSKVTGENRIEKKYHETCSKFSNRATGLSKNLIYFSNITNKSNCSPLMKT